MKTSMGSQPVDVGPIPSGAWQRAEQSAAPHGRLGWLLLAEVGRYLEFFAIARQSESA